MIKNYFKIALRNLKMNKTYAFLNFVGLSMGMTGAVLIFLFLQHHLNTDRHHQHADRIFRVVHDLLLDEGTEHSTGSSLPLTASLARDYATVEKAGMIRKLPEATFSSEQAGRIKRFKEKENVVFADQGFMDLFAFGDGQHKAVMNEPGTVVITEAIAEKYFGTREAEGMILKLNNTHHLKVATVLTAVKKPTDLRFDIYISLPTLTLVEPEFELDNYHWLSGRNVTFVRLTDPGKAADTEKQIRAKGTKYYGEIAKYYNHKLQPLSDVHFDEKYDGKIRRSILWILAGVGCFLLAIACINFINLATAQALKRSKEIGIRKVLGSTRRQLFWQFMNETALLAISASLGALVFTLLLLPVLGNLTHTQAFEAALLFQWELLLFWLLALVLIILFAGFYPAVIVSGFNPIAALKSGLTQRQTGGIGLRRSLITTQLVIAQILVTGSLVLMLQLKFFRNADMGFDQQAVVTVSLPETATGHSLKQSLKTELLQYPDISSVAYQHAAPTSAMGYGGSVKFDNRKDWEKFMIRDRFGDEDYLETYKMKLVAGRSFVVRDSLVEFVVNEEFVRKAGVKSAQEVIGKQLEDGNSGFKGPVVGVVKSFHLKSLQEAVEPCAIFAHPKLFKEVAVKLNTKDMTQSLANIQAAWQKVYPEEVFTYQFVDEQITRFYEKEQQLTNLIRLFSAAAIVICCLGLYGMVSFMVTQKKKEIGIRKVLGAGVDSIILLFGKEFTMLVMIAFVIATPVAWYVMNNWLNNFAYRIGLSWWIMASGGMAILFITLLTVGFKVVKAALMNPVKSIGSD